MKYLLLFAFIVLFSCGNPQYDLVIRNGMIVDGSGASAVTADLAVNGQKIIKIDENIAGKGKTEIDAAGLAVSPGFIDMLSWASGPILYDGEVHSVVRQGITLGIFGEGWSMGPVNDNVRKEMAGWWKKYNLKYDWNSLAEYMQKVEQQGTSMNIASYVGATTLRMYAVGFEDRTASETEMQLMKDLLRSEMQAGAFGVASSLVYTPAFFADTRELTELAKVAAEFDGVYASHIRGEGSDLLTALDEFIQICENSGVTGEIYHLKAAGKENWDKLEKAITKIESARQNGLPVFADVYPYTAAGTGLSAMLPPWAKEGGDSLMCERLKNKNSRAKIRNEILNSTGGWENFYRMSDGGKNIMISYLSDKNKDLQGKYLAEVAAQKGRDEIETLFDLLLEEDGGGGGIYFLMSEENVRRKIGLPWTSFDTDADAFRPEGLMGQSHPHPRSYGTFPRVLGKYVREEQVVTLEEAVRKMSGLPAQVLGLQDRGLLKEGFFADIVIFDPNTVTDKATFVQPHQFPEGINYVLVNGIVVINENKHTGAKPGLWVKRQ